MDNRIKDKLLRLAYDNPGVKNKYKLASGVVWRGRLITTGVNSYKTHPIMCNGAYKDEQICLHAEADALVRASRVMLPVAFEQSVLYVVRVCQAKEPSDRYGPKWLIDLGYTETIAKPCKGCLALIQQYGIKEVEWTE